MINETTTNSNYRFIICMIYKKVDVQRVVGAIKSLEALGDVVSSEMYQVLSNYERPIFKKIRLVPNEKVQR